MVFYHHFTLLMDRSPGFGSTSCNSFALLRLGLPSAPYLTVLNLAEQRNSPVRSTKSTRSHLVRALSACKHRVSGSLSLPSRGSFHLSLTVLCAIGHLPYLALEGGPPCFPPDSSCPVVLWIPTSLNTFRLRDFYPLRFQFPLLFNYVSFRFCRSKTPTLRRASV